MAALLLEGPSLHHWWPPAEGLAACLQEIDRVEEDHDVAERLHQRAEGREKGHHDDHDEGAHHPGDSLRDARHVLHDRRSIGLSAVDAPGESHGQEDVLHVRAKGIGDGGCGLVLLRHEDGGHGVRERRADGANSDAQEAVGKGRDVVVDLLSHLQHDEGEDGQPEHGPHEAQWPAALLADVLHVTGKERALQGNVNDELRNRKDLVEQTDVLAAPSMAEVLRRTDDSCIISVDPGAAKRALLDVLQELVALFLVWSLDPERHALQRVRELQLDDALAHDDDLLEVLVLQHGAQHGVLLVELEADGGALLHAGAFLLLGLLHRLRVDALLRGVQRPHRGARGAAVGHPAVHDLLDLHLNAVHLSLHAGGSAERFHGSGACCRPEGRDGVHNVGGGVYCDDVHNCSAKQDPALVPLDCLVEERPVEQDDGEGVEYAVARERHALDPQGQDRG
mmetsp:Transcript_49249/g.118363  ORF Transcript_49249/g.118363 Transcript_49249/m.118363 type:complete len:451 (+) Transcript_49249:272-1624(+)